MDLEGPRLRRFMQLVNDGKRDINGPADAERLLRAISQERDCVQCIARLTTNKAGLNAIRRAVCQDLSKTALNSHVARFVRYITAHELQQHNSGHMLCDLLTAVLTPPSLWSAFKTASAEHELTAAGLQAFASLIQALLKLLSPATELASELDVLTAARDLVISRQLHDSEAADVRNFAYKLELDLQDNTSGAFITDGSVNRPGGRHDNDFADFRKISIFPSTDELLSTETPYILPLDHVLQSDPQQRVASHIANQFRLLREDMLAELREDMKETLEPTKRKSRGMRLCGLQFSGISCGTSQRLKQPNIALRCFDQQFRKLPEGETERKAYIKKEKNFIKHNAVGCLVIDSRVIAFATIDRDEEALAKDPPTLHLRIANDAAVHRTLCALKQKRPHEIGFTFVQTPFFAYEPVLKRLQNITSLPLASALLGLELPSSMECSLHGLDEVAACLTAMVGQDVSSIVGSRRPLRLDQAQTASVVAGITQSLCAIQGPPGTGKSLIGTIIAKLLVDHTSATILCICYTNHALDQDLESYLEMGISRADIVRLGSKFTAVTEPLTMQNQTRTNARLTPAEYQRRQQYKTSTLESSHALVAEAEAYSRWKQNEADTLESLEFNESYEDYFDALSLPDTQDDMALIGSQGKIVDKLYLFRRWSQGRDAGIFMSQMSQRHQAIWQMSLSERRHCLDRWSRAAVAERADLLAFEMQQHEAQFSRWSNAKDSSDTEIMRNKRIIACTTTAAAKYAEHIARIRPAIVLVEEAGEVLESHILVALSRNTKQLVMIGDHLQLRPKVKNYALTVERGDGYDLNRSLFERLVVAGHPHSTLTRQHRMRPEISALVRRLMYPELQDSDDALSRAQILGLQNNVIFINHDHPEVPDGRVKDRQDGTSTGSHSNIFEAKMVLKIVKYLAQQGYGTTKQVVLTPYLGQLRLIMDEMHGEHDPVLSDLDSHDLVRAGLLSPAGALASKGSLRVSTVDNFQGEESEIVVASLTRSNEKGDIGFLSAAQRLNVLLSRARDGLILIGNAETFKRSRKGAQVWVPFFEQLIQAGCFFDGLPVKCEQHPSRMLVLTQPQDFDDHCPQGGCTLPCDAMLSCRKHQCPEKCHQLVDHSKMLCMHKIDVKCPQGHRSFRECWRGVLLCPKCERDSKLETLRQQRQDEYLRQLIALEDRIDLQRNAVKDLENEVERATTLKQKQAELSKATSLTENKSLKVKAKDSKTSATKKMPSGKHNFDSKSKACQAWQYQKDHDNAQNEHIDTIMSMIGLESVKLQLLNVKDKVDTSLRQEVSLVKERFNIIFLGNPGTGKTTVAREYAKCLASLGVVPGDCVEETSGSKLNHGGVTAYRALVDKLLNDEGGALFVDEAYLLTSGTASQGRQVLDAIMDDAENLIGKVVFILAGYQKEMESLLSHNPGLKSRFPYELTFEDYEDDELLQIFQQRLRTIFNDNMKVEDGDGGLYARIVARRIGYGRGRPGFGNARTVQNTLDKIRSRQANRLATQKRKGTPCDDFMLSREDLLGPEPSGALEQSKAWSDLQQLTGLDTVKRSVMALLQSLTSNYHRELGEKPLLQFNLNKVFSGSPGTGKTTVAKLYGRILADVGMLSNGEVVMKNPADFIGDVIGASETKTKGILAATIGKVLVIDEAYGLYQSGGVNQSADSFRTGVIDTLVAEVQSVPGDDRCVLLLGYQDEMENMLQNANPGLARRFPLADAFHFEDFKDDELLEILNLKLSQQSYNATDDAIDCVLESLKRARNKLHFGNAGEIDILLNIAKQRHQQRCSTEGLVGDMVLQAIDFDPDFSKHGNGLVSVTDLFQDIVGNEDIIMRLQNIQNVVLNLRAQGQDPRGLVPYNFVFCGPPGTGKTSTARSMGKVYHGLGILATDEVLERSASDLVAQYVGQTGPKTKQLLESALGKVLLIDEAYRLADGLFAKEALDELVDLLTKPTFAGKLIVILAGYDHDIQRLLSVNPGLSSRFPEKVSFRSLPPEACAKLLTVRLQQQAVVDASRLSLHASKQVLSAFSTLSHIGDWANARDVETLSKLVVRGLLQQADTSSTSSLSVSESFVLSVMEDMITTRQEQAAFRSLAGPDLDSSGALQANVQKARAIPPPAGDRSCRQPHDTSLQPNTEEHDDHVEEPYTTGDVQTSGRDKGVSDEIWSRLEADKQEAARQDKVYAELVRQCHEHESNQGDRDDTTNATADEQQGDTIIDEEARAARAKREQERIRYELLRREKKDMEEKRRLEEKAQQKLRTMGVCVQGFQWIKQATGYRCAGGAHYLSNEQLEKV